MIPATCGPSGASCCATRGPDCVTRHHRWPATPYVASLTGCLRMAPSAARASEYHSTTPLPRPSMGSKGVVVPATPPENPHWMITRGKIGFRVLPDRLVLATTSSPTPSPIPDPHWRASMEEGYGALMSNGTWELVPRPQGSNVIPGKWVFTHKLHADGALDRYKAR
jgi:hypothetical protein